MSPMTVGLSLQIVLVGSSSAADLASQNRATRIFGGSEVAECGWPTAVSLEGHCTGTLVHPQVVVYAAHCGTAYQSVTFGESVEAGRNAALQYCQAYPDFGPGADFAFCVLEDRQEAVPIVPPLMGCEVGALTPGQEVVVVGFGLTETGAYGTKFEVVTEIGLVDDVEVYVGGNGRDSCVGDSGGPVYLNLGRALGKEDSWRVFGITSHGGACGSGAFYSMMHVGMEWLEEQSGFDLTPCHTAAGEWAPRAACGMFPRNPDEPSGSWVEGCGSAREGDFSDSCGLPFDPSSDREPPTVRFIQPADGAALASEYLGTPSQVEIEVRAHDAGSGVSTVELLVNEMQVARGVLERPPWKFSIALRPGDYRLDALATDYAGNHASADPIHIGVGLDVPSEGRDSGCRVFCGPIPDRITLGIILTLVGVTFRVGRPRREQ